MKACGCSKTYKAEGYSQCWLRLRPWFTTKCETRSLATPPKPRSFLSAGGTRRIVLLTDHLSRFLCEGTVITKAPKRSPSLSRYMASHSSHSWITTSSAIVRVTVVLHANSSKPSSFKETIDRRGS